MDPKLANQTLQYVQVTTALTKRALDEVQVHRDSQEKAASMRNNVLESLIEAGCVGETQKQAAEAMLGSHAETLNLLKLASDKIKDQQAKLVKHAGDLGAGVDPAEVGANGSVKSADEYDSMTDGYVGRKTSEKKASDEAILKVLHDPS
jgi:hypothetical protein